MVSVFDQRPARSWVRIPLAAGGRVATVGQLLFVYPWPGLTQPSILSGSVNEYGTGYGWGLGIRQVCATLLGARHVPERLCGGSVYLGRYNKKLSYCWETVRRESMPRIAEMDVEMTT